MKNNLTYLTHNSLNSRLTARHRRRLAGASVLFKNASIAAGLALLAFVPAALAQDNDTWVGNTDDTWGTGANWTFSSGTATAVASGDSLFFGVAGSSGAALNNNLSGFSFSGITFSSGASAYVFSGNSFGLAGGITNNSTSAEIISNNIALSGTKFFSANGNLTLGGVISGSGFGISKTGANTLILSGANTYGGTTTLFAGGLDINNPSALGTGALIIGGSTTIDNTSGGSISNSQNNAQNWNGNFTFAGTTNLNLGTGAVTLGASP
ncbi:MAG: autotransporter-associated beta strand repeat-containing protein, partial [Verrucomicrobiota bacterium]